MEEIRQLYEWHQSGIRAAMATVIQTWGSSPRPVGSILAVSETGDIVGSVSGGCVESEVILACQSAIISGETQFLDFKQISEKDAWEVGLTCGGRVEVFVEPSPYDSDDDYTLAIWELFQKLLEDGVTYRLYRNLSAREDFIGIEDLMSTFGVARVAEIEQADESLAFEVSAERWFLLIEFQPIHLIVVGASHIAIPLFQIANAMGMSTTLIDPRAQLAEQTRFPVQPNKTFVGWPEEIWLKLLIHSKSCVITLSHDDKIDIPALAAALRSNVRYIGALGSKATQMQRRDKLREIGFEDSEIDRIHGPIGLNIGAKSPEEIALSIVVEIIQEFRNAN